jgi:hypothetical protein
LSSTRMRGPGRYSIRVTRSVVSDRCPKGESGFGPETAFGKRCRLLRAGCRHSVLKSASSRAFSPYRVARPNESPL